MLPLRVATLVASTTFLVDANVAAARDNCPGPAGIRGEIVAFDGTVVGTSTSGASFPISLGAPLCAGDQLETGAQSRVEFRLTGKDTTTGTSSNSLTVIPSSESDCVELKFGFLKFISSVVGTRYCVQTPLIDAGIDGTEALVVVDNATDDSFVLVREGSVSVRDLRGTVTPLSLDAGGEQATSAAFATRTQSLTLATPENVPKAFRSLLLRPEEAADWAIYYPPVLLTAGVSEPQVLRAASLLDGGDVDAADALLQQVVGAGRTAAAALSLRAIIAISQNRIAEGRAFADAAVQAGPGLSAAHISQSYERQADGQINDARASALIAVEADPGDAYAWARLAELHMTIGDVADARNAAERSLLLTQSSLAHAVLGFAELASYRFSEADEAFRSALQIDNEAPLARLGLGLLKIRQGDVAAGRLELETAVALDPRRASLRTWLGRAYFEEGDAEKAANQFALAIGEDPDDPNAYLFSALTLYSENRPIEALRALEKARDVGDGRATVRSSTGLAEDRAVRGAALGRIYDVLGLEQRALAEGARAVDADPTNPEAHRFMGNIFRTQRNSEIAQTSELLKADLLSPPSKTPLQPQLVEADLGLLETTGPSRVTFSEFGPAFDTNGFRFDVSGVAGSFGDEISATFLHDNFSITAGQLYYEEDGFRANNDLQHEVYGVQAKFAPAPWLTLFGEYRLRETEAGDRELDFFGTFDPTFRQELEREFLRVGFRTELSSEFSIIGLATIGRLDGRDESMPFLTIDSVETDNAGYRSRLAREDYRCRHHHRLNRDRCRHRSGRYWPARKADRFHRPHKSCHSNRHPKRSRYPLQR